MEKTCLRQTIVLSLIVLGGLSFLVATGCQSSGNDDDTPTVTAAQWARTFSQSSSTLGDEATAIHRTADQGYLFLGGCGQGLMLFKLDQTGEIQWTKLLHGGAHRGMTSTSDGGYVVSSTETPGIWLDKFSAGHALEWQKGYDYPAEMYATAGIRQTADGGYVIAGLIQDSADPSNPAAYVLKLDGEGAIEWQNAYGGFIDGPYYAEATSICQTPDGGFVVGANILGFGSTWGEGSAWIAKLDPSGGLEWHWLFRTGGDLHWPTLVRPAPDGGILLITHARGSGAGGLDVLAVKFLPDGQISRQMTYGGSGDEFPTDVDVTEDGRLAITGLVGSVSMLGLELDAQGQVTWNRYFDTGGWWGSAIEKLDDGSCVLAGGVLAGGNSDILILKTNTTGNIPGCGLEHDDYNVTAAASSFIPLTVPCTVRAAGAVPAEVGKPTSEVTISSALRCW